MKINNICCIGAGYVGGPTMAVIADKCDHLKINVLLVTANTFCLFLLGLSTNKITFHQDAASYHLNNQAFIRSEKVILGFSNLHVRYGFSSMSEYVNSFFWVQDNFIFVHFVNLIFVSVFYIFLIWVCLSSKDMKLKLLSITVALEIDSFNSSIILF